MTRQCLEITLRTARSELGRPKENSWRFEGEATLPGETATLPIDASLLLATPEQDLRISFMEPGSKLNVFASPLARGDQTLWIIEQVFFDEDEWVAFKAEQEEKQSSDLKNAFLNNLEFLAWVGRCTFPGDFERDLLKLGVDPDVAFSLRMNITAQKGRVKTIVELYQDNVNASEEKEALALYLTDMHLKHESILKNQQTRPTPKLFTSDEPGL